MALPVESTQGPGLTETQSDPGFYGQEGKGKVSMQNFTWALRSGAH